MPDVSVWWQEKIQVDRNEEREREKKRERESFNFATRFIMLLWSFGHATQWLLGILFWKARDIIATKLPSNNKSAEKNSGTQQMNFVKLLWIIKIIVLTSQTFGVKNQG